MLDRGRSDVGAVVSVSLTDTHCHLDLPAFDVDRDAVLARARDAGLKRFMVPALDVESSQRIVTLVSEHMDVYGAVGLHPTEAGRLSPEALDQLLHLCTNPKVRAIGGIGLEYYWVTDHAARAAQRASLEQQLDLATRAGLPVILHLREAEDAEGGDGATDLVAILEHWVGALRAGAHPLADRPGVLHSFAGTLQTARRAIELGFWIGVTGPITYKNAEARRALIASLPLERLLLETDSPYLPPVPHRAQRNEPAFVAHIADKIAGVQSRSLPEVARVTAANADRLFAWGEVA